MVSLKKLTTTIASNKLFFVQTDMKDQNSLKQNTLKKKCISYDYGEKENKCVLKENKKKEQDKKQKVEEANIGKSALIFKSIHIIFMSYLTLIAFDLSAFLTEMNKTLFIY